MVAMTQSDPSGVHGGKAGSAKEHYVILFTIRENWCVPRNLLVAVFPVRSRKDKLLIPFIPLSNLFLLSKIVR